MKRKVICILMSSILSLSSAQVQTIFAEEMTITDGLSESENSDVIENENLQIEDQTETVATVYKGNIIKNLIMDCQSYTKYRPNETTGGIFVSWRRKEELPTGA